MKYTRLPFVLNASIFRQGLMLKAASNHGGGGKASTQPRVTQTSEQCQLASLLSDLTSEPQIPFQSPSSIPHTSHSLPSTLFLLPAPAPTLHLHSVLQPLPYDKKKKMYYTTKNRIKNKNLTFLGFCKIIP